MKTSLIGADLIPESDIAILTDEDVAEDANKVVDIVVKHLVQNTKLLWVDISQPIELPEDGEETVLTMLLNHASIITCTDEKLQEDIYMLNGEISVVLPDVESKEDYLVPDRIKSVKHILWYGETKDRLGSPKLEQVTYKNTSDIDVIKLDKFDLVYLPVTVNEAAEKRRLSKVRECIRKGKLVAAPDCGAPYCINLPLKLVLEAIKLRKINSEKEIRNHQRLLKASVNTRAYERLLKEKLTECKKILQNT